MAVAAVGRAGFASGSLGLGLGRPFGEGSGLAFGLPTGLVEFALQAFVLLTKLLDESATLLQLLEDREGDGHRVAHLDRRQWDLVAAGPARQLLCGFHPGLARGR